MGGWATLYVYGMRLLPSSCPHPFSTPYDMVTGSRQTTARISANDHCRLHSFWTFSAPTSKGLVTNGILYIVTGPGEPCFIARIIWASSHPFLLPRSPFMFCRLDTIPAIHYTYSETATSAVCVWFFFFLSRVKILSKWKYSFLFWTFLGNISFISFGFHLHFFFIGTRFNSSLSILKSYVFQKIVPGTREFCACLAFLWQYFWPHIPILLIFYWYFDIYIFCGHKVSGANGKLFSQWKRNLCPGSHFFSTTLIQPELRYFLFIL